MTVRKQLPNRALNGAWQLAEWRKATGRESPGEPVNVVLTLTSGARSLDPLGQQAGQGVQGVAA